jgi:hypothetical protein
LKSGHIQYKIDNTGKILPTAQTSGQTQVKNVEDIQVDEFLKLKKSPNILVKKDSLTNSSEEFKDKKPKFNLILQPSPQKHQTKQAQQPQIVTLNPKTPTTIASPNKAQILNIEKILPISNQLASKQVVVPIMVRKDGTDTSAQIIHQAFSMSTNHLDTKTVTNQPFAYVQMKIQPNADGQYTLAPAHTSPQPLQLSLSPQQIQQLTFQTQQSQSILAMPHQLPSITSQETEAQAKLLLNKSDDSCDEIFANNDNFDDDDDDDDDEEEDDDYCQIEKNETINEVQKKLTTSSDKTSNTKKIIKTIKSSKAKVQKCEVANSININEKHSDIAKQQLNQLTSLNCKRVEVENAEKSGEINLTICDVSKNLKLSFWCEI